MKFQSNYPTQKFQVSNPIPNRSCKCHFKSSCNSKFNVNFQSKFRLNVKYHASNPKYNFLNIEIIYSCKICASEIWTLKHQKNMYTIVPLPFSHVSQIIFHFVEFFQFLICAKTLIKSKIQLLGFQPQTFHDNDLKLRQSKHTRVFHNINKTLFIIFL